MERMSQSTRFTILVVDRNPNVRDFLKRELLAEGFQVDLARNAEEVLDRIYRDENIDMVIIDPDLPDAPQKELLNRLSDRIPGLHVVVHSLSPLEEETHETDDISFVQKGGRSIEALKRVVMEFLTQDPPQVSSDAW